MILKQPTGLTCLEDYFAWENASDRKHEFSGGRVYAMVGASDAHVHITTNIVVALGVRLRGRRFQPRVSDQKVRVRLPNETRVYYPDVTVIDRPGARDALFQDAPLVIVEVLSESTRRVDEVEKKDAYLAIPSLRAYLLVEQDAPRVVLHRRGASGFAEEHFDGLTATIPLPEIETELPLAEVYERVEFPAAPG